MEASSFLFPQIWVGMRIFSIPLEIILHVTAWGGHPAPRPRARGSLPTRLLGPWGAAAPPQVMLTLAVCLPPGHRGGCRGLRHPRRGHRSERGQHRLGPALLGHVLLDLSGREYAGRCPWGWPASELSFGLSGRVAVGGPGAPWLFGTKE